MRSGRTISLAVLLTMFVVLFLAPAASAAPGPGVYSMSFNPGTVVGGNQYFVIAHVADSLGADATKGTVVFQVCNVGKSAVIKPSSDCAEGATGRWQTFSKKAVNEFGFASDNALAQVVSSPILHGWRIKYMGQGSGIPNGLSQPADVTVIP